VKASILIFWYWLLFALPGALASSDEPLDKIRLNLLKHPSVVGEFKQVREIKDLKLKLNSTGTFTFKVPLELNWIQIKPFAMTILMTPDKIIQKNSDSSTMEMTKQSQPVVFIFSSSFLSIFSGDIENIKKSFTYQIDFKRNDWTMSLVPKDELLKKVISMVKIEGQDFVKKVEVTESTGNTTSIYFMNTRGK
jgi:hypothetical protein